MPPAVSPAAPAPRAPLLTEPRREALVLAGGALLIVLLTAAVALLLWRSREDSLATWRLYLHSFSATAAEHAMQTFKTADFALGSIVDHVQAAGVENEAQLRRVAGSRAMYDFIHDRAAELPLMDMAALVTLDGELLNASRSFPPPAVSLADRAYLDAHRSDPALGLYISAPIKSRVTGRWTIFLVRKIRSPSGQTLGLALAGIETSYFARFYRSINLSERDTALLLLRSDGVLLARHPPRPTALGMSYRDTPSMRALAEARARGELSALVRTSVPRISNPADTEPRMAAAHAVQDFPLAVSVTTNETLMLGPWRETAWFCGVGVAVLDVAIAALALWIHRLLRRRRTALQQLDAAHRAAEAAGAVKTQFLSNLRHEVQGPLQGLVGMAQRLLATPLQPAQRQQAQIIERSGRLLLGSIDDVLSFSRLAAEPPALEPVPVDLKRLAQDCLALQEPQARLKLLALRLEVDPAVAADTVAMADPLRLSQVLGHLLAHAVKLTPAGGVTLRLSRPAPGRWRLAVRDGSVGLSAEQRAQLFDPFTAPPDGPAARGGAGLGLATAQRLVALMGGTLDARALPEGGVEVWCELVLPPAAEAVDMAPAPAG